MATPGMLIMSNMAPGSLEQYTTYVKKAEERGLRNFLVTESFTDSLALAQHLASVTSKFRSVRVLPTSICATRSLRPCTP